MKAVTFTTVTGDTEVIPDEVKALMYKGENPVPFVWLICEERVAEEDPARTDVNEAVLPLTTVMVTRLEVDPGVVVAEKLPPLPPIVSEAVVVAAIMSMAPLTRSI
jgi:hypothetical protein